MLLARSNRSVAPWSPSRVRKGCRAQQLGRFLWNVGCFSPECLALRGRQRLQAWPDPARPLPVFPPATEFWMNWTSRIRPSTRRMTRPICCSQPSTTAVGITVIGTTAAAGATFGEGSAGATGAMAGVMSAAGAAASGSASGSKGPPGESLTGSCIDVQDPNAHFTNSRTHSRASCSPEGDPMQFRPAIAGSRPESDAQFGPLLRSGSNPSAASWWSG